MSQQPPGEIPRPGPADPTSAPSPRLVAEDREAVLPRDVAIERHGSALPGNFARSGTCPRPGVDSAPGRTVRTTGRAVPGNVAFGGDSRRLRPEGSGATWPYRPPYLPEGVSIPMAANSSVPNEPLLFFLPTVAAPPRRLGTDHPNGARAITRVRITLRGREQRSPELAWLEASGSVQVQRGQREVLALDLDGGAQGGHLHVPSPTPLHLSW